MEMKDKQKAVRFGKTVKKRLIDLNMSQAELAAQLHMSKIYLCRILSGDRSGRTYRDRIIKALRLDDAA